MAAPRAPRWPNVPRPNDPTGSFCANDLLAGGGPAVLHHDGALQIPGDMALVGYDDIDFASAAIVALTSVRQPAHLIGRTAVDLLLEQIVAGPDQAAPRAVVFQPELIIRDSSRRRP